MNFEQILEFATNMLQTELFLSTKYVAYEKSRRERKDLATLAQEFSYHREYRFIFEFKEKFQKIHVDHSFIVFFEQRFMNVRNKMS